MAVIKEYVKNLALKSFKITALSCTSETTKIPLKSEEGKPVKDTNGKEVYTTALCRANKGFGEGFYPLYSHATGTWLQYNEVHVCNFREFAEFLSSIAEANQTFIIRGKLREGLIDPESTDEKDYVRNGHKLYSDNSKKTFFESNPEGLPWAMFDIDKLATPEGLNIIDHPKECAEYVVSLFPQYFHNSSYHFQLSSSAGKNPKIIKMHLFFWFKELLTDSEINKLSEKINNYHIAKILETYTGDAALIPNLLDKSITHASQPHYTAAPSFVNQNDNPFKNGRNFTVDKASDCVVVPNEIFVAVKELAKKYVELKTYEGLEDFVNPFCKWKGIKYSSWFEEKLKLIGYTKSYTGIFEAACAYIAQVQIEFADTVALKKEIICYIENLPEDLHELNGGKYYKSDLYQYCADSSINNQIKNALNGALNYQKTKAEATKKAVEAGGTTVKKYLTTEEAKVIIDQTYDEFFDDPKDMFVNMTSGGGKTTQFLEKAKAKGNSGIVGEFFFLNHKLAYAAKEKLLSAPAGKPKWCASGAVPFHPYARHWKWEDTEEYMKEKSLNPNYEDLVIIDGVQQHRQMCHHCDAAKILGDKGVSIYPRLCHTRVKVTPENVEPSPWKSNGMGSKFKESKPVNDAPKYKEVFCDYYYHCGYMRLIKGESSVKKVTFIKNGKEFESYKWGYYDQPQFTHNLLMTDTLGQERSALHGEVPDYAMADEGVFDKLIEQTPANSKGFTFEVIDHMPLSKALKLALKGADPELPLLKQLKDMVGEQQLLIDLDTTLKMLKEKAKNETLIGKTPDEQIELAKKVKNPAKTLSFVSNLRKELLLKKDVCSSITRKKIVNPITKKITYLNEYTMQFRKDITRLGEAPVIFLNGDYTPEIYKKIRKDIKIVSVELERKVHKIQVYDRSCSKSRIVNDESYFINGIQNCINLFGETTRVAVIGLGYLTGNANADVLAKLKVNSVSWLEHYGNQRGKNDFEDADVVITISDNNPPFHALITEAKGFYYDDVDPIPDDPKLLEKVPRKYTTKAGFSRWVDVYEHVDHRVRDMHSGKRECEVLQAGDRGRFIYPTKDKLWINFSSMPLDREGGVNPDNLVTFEEACNLETKLSKVFKAADGCLPLAIDYLTSKHPDMGTGYDWKNYFKNEVGGTDLPALRNASLVSAKDSADWKLYQYKTKGSGQLTKCLSKYDYDETLSRLSAMVSIVKLLDKTL